MRFGGRIDHVPRTYNLCKKKEDNDMAEKLLGCVIHLTESKTIVTPPFVQETPQTSSTYSLLGFQSLLQTPPMRDIRNE